MKRSMIAVLLLAAACSRAGDEPAASEGNAEAAEENGSVSAEAPQVPPLAGQWQVTAVDGRPLTQIFTMTAEVTESRFRIVSDCVSMSWNFQQNGNALTLANGSTVECERGRTTNEDQVERALSGANMALFSNEGREVQLSGFRGTISMTRR